MSTIQSLKGYQRAWLKKKAHTLSPVVSVGTSGLTDAVEKAFIEAVKCHELVKVKFSFAQAERREMSEHLAAVSGAALVSILGNNAILYKAAEIKENRTYSLPQR